MIHPTRTNLLLLKEKTRSVSNSIGILKARKQALIREFLTASMTFLRSREDIRTMYGNALRELAFSVAHEGIEGIESIVSVSQRDFKIDIAEKSIWGLRYKDIIFHDAPVREPEERGYDEFSTSPRLDESTLLFEKLLESMLNIAQYECKMKRLGQEILRTTRKIRVLEELVVPELKKNIRTITQFIGERDRESYFRLKKFKELRTSR